MKTDAVRPSALSGAAGAATKKPAFYGNKTPALEAREQAANRHVLWHLINSLNKKYHTQAAGVNTKAGKIRKKNKTSARSGKKWYKYE